MNFLIYIFLGFLQGITEPLPISSSGHLFLFKSLFVSDIFSDLNLEIFLNFSSFLAILLIYRNIIRDLCSGFFRYFFKNDSIYYYEYKYIWLIVVGTIPVCLCGYFFNDFLEKFIYSYPLIISLGFIVTGILLIIVSNYNCIYDLDISYRNAFIIGIFQILALFPGVSRSGMTLVGSLLCGISKDDSLKYSFMLYFPVSILTMIVSFNDLLSSKMSLKILFFYLVAMGVSFFSTYISFSYLKKVVLRGNLWKFSIYLFIIGIISLFIL